jgi:hypothetical protein
MAKCWRCGSILFLHPATGNCFICGYSQDAVYVALVKVKQALHDLTESNPQSSGNDKNYRIKHKWSMND